MTASSPAPIGTRARPPRRTRQGHRHRALRLRVPRRGARCTLHPIQATIARGRITAMDTSAAEALDGVVAVLTVFDAPALADTSDGDLTVLQDDQVHYRGQLIGGVIAESAETARHAAGLVHVDYDAAAHDTEIRADHPGLYAPEQVNPDYETDTSDGDVEAALRDARSSSTQTYTTPHEHNNPMEPHATIAIWDAERRPQLTLYDSTQGVHVVRQTIAKTFGLEEEQIRVVAKNVGGGFGSKGAPHSHNVLAVMAAATCGRAPGQAGAHPAADVRRRRLPHADHPAHPARRRA